MEERAQGSIDFLLIIVGVVVVVTIVGLYVKTTANAATQAAQSANKP